MCKLCIERSRLELEAGVTAAKLATAVDKLSSAVMALQKAGYEDSAAKVNDQIEVLLKKLADVNSPAVSIQADQPTEEEIDKEINSLADLLRGMGIPVEVQKIPKV